MQTVQLSEGSGFAASFTLICNEKLFIAPSKHRGKTVKRSSSRDVSRILSALSNAN